MSTSSSNAEEPVGAAGAVGPAGVGGEFVDGAVGELDPQAETAINATPSNTPSPNFFFTISSYLLSLSFPSDSAQLKRRTSFLRQRILASFRRRRRRMQ